MASLAIKETPVNHRSLFLPILLVTITLTVSAVAIASEPSDHGRTTLAPESFANIAYVRASTEEDPVLRIGEWFVTEAEFREQIAAYMHQYEWMQAQLADLNQRNPGIAQAFSERLTLGERYSLETIALARLISDYALADEAVRRGYGATTEEVDQRVQHDRALVEQGLLPELEAYITVLGEKHYWDEIYPALIARTIAHEKLTSASLRGRSPQEASEIWLRIQHDAIRVTTVTIIVPEVLGDATVDAALRCLAEGQQIQAREMAREGRSP
jgi:hypothetical protein